MEVFFFKFALKGQCNNNIGTHGGCFFVLFPACQSIEATNTLRLFKSPSWSLELDL